jgi:hypothetical protein
MYSITVCGLTNVATLHTTCIYCVLPSLHSLLRYAKAYILASIQNVVFVFLKLVAKSHCGPSQKPSQDQKRLLMALG